MLYELRHYDTETDHGMRFVTRRFAEHVLPLFEKVRIEPVGFWTVLVGPQSPRLTYLLPWENLAQREERWDAFEADPDWQRIRSETNHAYGGSPIHTITNSILRPASCSPMPTHSSQPDRLAGGIYELRVATFRDYERMALGLRWFGEQFMPLMETHQMHLMGVWTTSVGIAPQMTYMLVFENLADRERTWAALRTDPHWQMAEEATMTAANQPIFIGESSSLMRGTEFSGWR